MTSINTIVSPIKTDERALLDFRAGDTIRVWQKVHEGEKTRLQAFEGIVLARKHGTEAGATFTVRKVSLGIGIERVFPLYSPEIDRIEIVSRASKHKRAKLYYIRDRAAREIRRKMKHVREDARKETIMEQKKKDDEKKESEANKEEVQEVAGVANIVEEKTKE
jgi:large subunit ribosomal protein L19